MLHYDREHLPGDEAPWQVMRKTALTRMTRIDGPFTVATREGALFCADGWLAIDAHGWPYPIAAAEQAQIYEDAEPDPEITR